MLRTRRTGGMVLADVHIIVDGALSVSEGHQISETVRHKLIEEIGEVSDVMVHIDPEDDETAPSSDHLPLRHDVEKRLNQCFARIPEAVRIEQLTLHYLAGKIHVDLFLPLEFARGKTEVDEMHRRFNAAIKDDPEIESIQLYFH